jgi:nicotinamidase-related amidase
MDSYSGRLGLVVVDLQDGITALPAAHPVGEIVARTRALADALRAKGHVIAWITIDFAADGGDLIRRRTDMPGPPPPPPGFATLTAGLNPQPEDIRVVKRTWNSFHATELELQLRRRDVGTVILSGIATSIGVESTARGAFDRDFDVVVAADTVTDPVAAAHAHSLSYVFPRLGRVRDSNAILSAL